MAELKDYEGCSWKEYSSMIESEIDYEFVQPNNLNISLGAHPLYEPLHLRQCQECKEIVRYVALGRHYALNHPHVRPDWEKKVIPVPSGSYQLKRNSRKRRRRIIKKSRIIFRPLARKRNIIQNATGLNVNINKVVEDSCKRRHEQLYSGIFPSEGQPMPNDVHPAPNVDHRDIATIMKKNIEYRRWWKSIISKSFNGEV